MQPDHPKPLPERAEWALRAREREGSVSSDGSWSTAPTNAESEGDYETADDLEDSVATLQEAFAGASSEGHVEETNSDEDDSVYHGRIEAVKLTGDPNIPRGEYTFIAPDIGPNGLLRVAAEDMFKGARIVKSVGHIAARGFRDGKCLVHRALVANSMLMCCRYIHDFPTHTHLARPACAVLGDIWTCLLLSARQHR
jgi:hypothetical protein